MASIIAFEKEDVKKNKIIKSNQLIEAKYRLTLNEQRLILAYISLLSPEYEEFPKVEIKIKDLIELLELNDKGFYRKIRETLEKLRSRTLVIRKPKGFLVTGWISSAEYFEDEGKVEIILDPKLKPYLLRLKQAFTTYALRNVLKLRSVYSIRIYELLKQYEKVGTRKFKIEELREILGILPNEYKRYTDFKRRVILTASKELKEKADIYFEFLEIKNGKKISEIEFLIFKNSKIKPLDKEEKEKQVQKEREELKKIYKYLCLKWESYLQKLSLKRLTIAQAIFFLENSLLDPDQTIKAIEADDLNPIIKNPIGTLFTTLPLRSKLTYLWLLRYYEEDTGYEDKRRDTISDLDNNWKKRWDEKWKIASEILKQNEIKYILSKLPESEEEAVELLSEVENKIAKILWKRLGKREKEDIVKPFKSWKNKDEEMFKVLVKAELFRRFNIPNLNLYVD